MKKSRKKLINRLKDLVGKEIIRIRPPFGNTIDETYTQAPVILEGFTKDGNLIVRKPDEYLRFVLPDIYTDGLWISLKNAQRAKGNSLNSLKGQYVKRTKIALVPMGFSYDFMETPVRLVSATRHHVFLKTDDGKTIIRNYFFADPEDWAVAG